MKYNYILKTDWLMKTSGGGIRQNDDKNDGK